ncbi:hypothetical protein AMECASPLE_033204 [Ameca splendens]|uniref:Uncharacterized protein n=1 Tax=Ameca splendens TaxID=208324 RepID=A0ABV0YIA2_9TELE
MFKDTEHIIGPLSDASDAVHHILKCPLLLLLLRLLLVFPFDLRLLKRGSCGMGSSVAFLFLSLLMGSADSLPPPQISFLLKRNLQHNQNQAEYEKHSAASSRQRMRYAALSQGSFQ